MREKEQRQREGERNIERRGVREKGERQSESEKRGS